MAPLPEAYYGKTALQQAESPTDLHVVPCRKAANVVRRGATCDARTPERRNKDGLPAQDPRRRTRSACGFALLGDGRHRWRYYGADVPHGAYHKHYLNDEQIYLYGRKN